MKHLWTLLCYRAIQDKATKQLTIVDTIEELTLHDRILPSGEHTLDLMGRAVNEVGVIMVPIKMEMVSQWTRSDREKPESGQVRFDIRPHKGKLLGYAEADISLQDKRNGRYTLRFNEFPITGPGHYSIVVRYRQTGVKKWKRVTAVPLQMIFGERASEEGEGAGV